jgi:FkbM family methyltransferase
MTQPETVGRHIELLPTRWGRMYAFTNDTGVSESLRAFGEYAVQESALYCRLLAPGEVFVDVGCNIGAVARAVITGVEGVTVVGFEPQVDYYRVASANLFLHDPVRLYPIAAGDTDAPFAVDEVDLRKQANYGGLAVGNGARTPQRIPSATVRLDGFLGARGLVPRLVKIDAEGMEAAVLRGMTGLRHDRLVISAEADRPALVPALMAELAAGGYACFAAFFRSIDPANPRYDPDNWYCRTVHVHVLAFAAAPPDWITAVPGVWPIGSTADFAHLWGKHFPGK